VLAAKHKIDETTSLKWWKEAFEYGACTVPVLDIVTFETHLRKSNGLLKPRGNCTTTSPWGYLLHALAINPGDGVLRGSLPWTFAERRSVTWLIFTGWENNEKKTRRSKATDNDVVDVVSLSVCSTGVLLMKTTSSRNSKTIVSPCNRQTMCPKLATGSTTTRFLPM
jgi:hypothetical protein